MIPSDFPKRGIVRYYYDVWSKKREDGTTLLADVLKNGFFIAVHVYHLCYIKPFFDDCVNLISEEVYCIYKITYRLLTLGETKKQTAAAP